MLIAAAFAVVSAGSATASERLCSADFAKRIDSPSEFCSCKRYSGDAIEVLRKRKQETWYSAGVQKTCPLRAAVVMRGLLFVAAPDDVPVVIKNQVAVGSGTGSTDQTTAQPSVSEPTPTEPSAPEDSAPSSKERDDNGHGNDADGVDESNPGGKR